VAEIHVERKGPVIWPWIIGLIVLAVLVWGLVEMYGDRGAVVGDDVMPDTIMDMPSAAPAPPP